MAANTDGRGPALGEPRSPPSRQLLAGSPLGSPHYWGAHTGANWQRHLVGCTSWCPSKLKLVALHLLSATRILQRWPKPLKATLQMASGGPLCQQGQVPDEPKFAWVVGQWHANPHVIICSGAIKKSFLA